MPLASPSPSPSPLPSPLPSPSAYSKTKKHVCITVSASRAQAGSGTQRLLLNHITTPHVTIASAVAASCALPGVMKPANLDVKVSGKIKPFEVDGVQWIDGSVQADIPFKRIGTLFNVTNFIVCQCNFHVVPFLNKCYNPDMNSWYWKLFQSLEWDIRNRVLNLSRLGLFPKLFGQDISKVFKQKYHGNVTIVPRMNIMQIIGVKALLNPTFEDMQHYLKNGQQAAWPHIHQIKHLLAIETAMAACINSLEKDLNMCRSSIGGGYDSLMIREAEAEVKRSSRKVNLEKAEISRLLARVAELESENACLRSRLEAQGRPDGIVDESSSDSRSGQAERNSQSQAHSGGGGIKGEEPIKKPNDDDGWTTVKSRQNRRKSN